MKKDPAGPVITRGGEGRARQPLLHIFWIFSPLMTGLFRLISSAPCSRQSKVQRCSLLQRCTEQNRPSHLHVNPAQQQQNNRLTHKQSLTHTSHITQTSQENEPRFQNIHKTHDYMNIFEVATYLQRTTIQRYPTCEPNLLLTHLAFVFLLLSCILIWAGWVQVLRGRRPALFPALTLLRRCPTHLQPTKAYLSIIQVTTTFWST